MVFGLLEMRFQTEVPNVIHQEIIEDSFDYNFAQNFNVEPEKKLETKSPKKSVQAPIFKQVSNDSGEEDPIKTILDPTPSINTSTPDFKGLEKKPVDVDVPIVLVQKVPVYPGCEKETTNIGRRECMSDKIQKIVRRNFNSELASDLNLIVLS